MDEVFHVNLPVYIFPFIVTALLLTCILLCCPQWFSPKVKKTDCPTFSVDDLDAARESIKEQGYAVISRVLDGEDIAEASRHLWNFLQGGVSKVGTPLPEELQTWHAWPSECNPATGLIEAHGIGQTSFMWYLRTRPLVRRVYEAVWNTSHLMVSFEGCMLFRPWHQNKQWKTKPQNFQLNHGPRCALPAVVRGMVVLTEMNTSTGGLVVLPQSHREHEDILASRVKVVTNRHIHVPTSHPAFKRFPPVQVKAQKGDFILWDSRLIHSFRPAESAPPITQQSKQNPEWLFVSAFVTMVPREWASEESHEYRKKAFKGHKTCNFVPHELEIVDDPFPDDAYPPRNRKVLEYADNALL